MPSYLPPLLGAILGLLVLITILCAVLFCLRRKRAQQKRLQSDSAASTVRKNRQTWSWLLGVYGDEKRGHGLVDPTPSTEPPNPFDASAVTSPMTEETDPIETAGRPLYEMPGLFFPLLSPVTWSITVLYVLGKANIANSNRQQRRSRIVFGARSPT